MSMTEDEKRKFIENLAETSTQKKVFYRWQSQKVHDNLLQVGEMTPKLYRHFMGMNDTWAGAGLYVAEDVLSSHQFGSSLLQVEIEPGYKYLNLLDDSVQQKLESVGLTNEDVYRLNPKIAITDIKENQPYWVLKEQKGIKFKPFSSSLYTDRATGRPLRPQQNPRFEYDRTNGSTQESKKRLVLRRH